MRPNSEVIIWGSLIYAEKTVKKTATIKSTSANNSTATIRYWFSKALPRKKNKTTKEEERNTLQDVRIILQRFRSRVLLFSITDSVSLTPSVVSTVLSSFVIFTINRPELWLSIQTYLANCV